jgi:hypothetical protein
MNAYLLFAIETGGQTHAQLLAKLKNAVATILKMLFQLLSSVLVVMVLYTVYLLAVLTLSSH